MKICRNVNKHATRISIRGLSDWTNKYIMSSQTAAKPKQSSYDVIVIGGGHNGLITSTYLAKAGKRVLVLERRDIVGGAAVTEEIFSGFRYSRCSYLAGLLRPVIVKELNLEKHGLHYLIRDPSSFTPTIQGSHYDGKYLLLGSDEQKNYESISQFSVKDAENYPKYEGMLGKIRDILQPMLDCHPISLFWDNRRSFREFKYTLETATKTFGLALQHREVLPEFYELLTGPAEHILDRWFESDILKTTLATDAVVGALVSPKHAGSGYVLLHHVMGEAAGRKGVWAYVRGGMGAISQAIASAARAENVEIVTSQNVRRIIEDGGKAVGVELDNGGEVITAKDAVISACTPFHAMTELMDLRTHGNEEIRNYAEKVAKVDYSCGSVKINCAVDRLPNFTCFPSPSDGTPGPMHFGTVHFESHMSELDLAYHQAAAGRPADRPVIEMTIPSSRDNTLAPPGKHVVQLFVQFAPYQLNPQLTATQGDWSNEDFKRKFAEQCFRVVEEFCPGFMSSLLHYECLSPKDLERTFGLHGGSISHGALGLHQIFVGRPVVGYSGHRTPVKGLYLASAGTHPGGGVIGAPGRNCARVVLSDLHRGMPTF